MRVDGMFKFLTLRGSSLGFTGGTKGHARLALLVIHVAEEPHLSPSRGARSEISFMNLIRTARVSSLNLANQIYIGDARRFRGRAVAARLHRIKYCVGGRSRSLILSRFFNGCGGCGAYIVFIAYVVRALYTPVGSPTISWGVPQPSQRRCVSGALLEERPRRNFPLSLPRGGSLGPPSHYPLVMVAAG